MSVVYLYGCVCTVCACVQWAGVGVGVEPTAQHEANWYWQDWRPCSQGEGTR